MKWRLVEERACGTQGEEEIRVYEQFGFEHVSWEWSWKSKNMLKETECEDVDRIQLAQNRDQE